MYLASFRNLFLSIVRVHSTLNCLLFTNLLCHNKKHTRSIYILIILLKLFYERYKVLFTYSKLTQLIKKKLLLLLKRKYARRVETN